MGNVLALICTVVMAGSPHIGGPAFVMIGNDSPADSASTVERVFGDVRSGMLENSIGKFSVHFGPRVFIQLPESEGAFFSAKQAFYVLDHFLRDCDIIAVQFTSTEASGLNPYATGNATYALEGTRRDARLYIVLVQRGDRWMITHFSIQ